jgi:hypothetical protein
MRTVNADWHGSECKPYDPVSTQDFGEVLLDEESYLTGALAMTVKKAWLDAHSRYAHNILGTESVLGVH